jgi:hypothetical protein
VTSFRAESFSSNNLRWTSPPKEIRSVGAVLERPWSATFFARNEKVLASQNAPSLSAKGWDGLDWS